jgi:threonine synthase
MTSANSINMGRLLPQMVYYFHAVAQLQLAGITDAPVMTVPSGNFGNITAAILAHRMGLSVRRFVAATNANDVVPRFLDSGTYDPHETIVTLANAMDVGDPSNFSRMYELYNNQLEELKGNLISFAINDQEIKETIKEVYKRLNYLMDPHTAAAYCAIKHELKERETGIFVSTAHPFKFGETIDSLIPGGLKKSGYDIDFPLLNRNEINSMPNDYAALRTRIEKMA